MASKEVEKAFGIIKGSILLYRFETPLSQRRILSALETLEKEVEQRPHKLAEDLSLGTIKL